MSPRERTPCLMLIRASREVGNPMEAEKQTGGLGAGTPTYLPSANAQRLPTWTLVHGL